MLVVTVLEGCHLRVAYVYVHGQDMVCGYAEYEVWSALLPSLRVSHFHTVVNVSRHGRTTRILSAAARLQPC